MQTRTIITNEAVYLYCDKVSDYFRNLENDAEAWTIAPEYNWLETMLLCDIIRLGAHGVLFGVRH